MRFYYTRLHSNKVHAVASFKDGSKIEFKLQGRSALDRAELLDQCEQFAQQLAQAKGEVCEY